MFPAPARATRRICDGERSGPKSASPVTVIGMSSAASGARTGASGGQCLRCHRRQPDLGMRRARRGCQVEATFQPGTLAAQRDNERGLACPRRRHDGELSLYRPGRRTRSSPAGDHPTASSRAWMEIAESWLNWPPPICTSVCAGAPSTRQQVALKGEGASASLSGRGGSASLVPPISNRTSHRLCEPIRGARLRRDGMRHDTSRSAATGRTARLRRPGFGRGRIPASVAAGSYRPPRSRGAGDRRLIETPG